MTKGKQSGGMKSALELAMERMQKSEGEIVPLTAGQKAAIAEIEAEAKAKVAEVEIMSRQHAQAAAAAGDAEAARKIEEERTAEIARIRDRAAVKKRKVREQ
jgi:hypothetical protein